MLLLLFPDAVKVGEASVLEHVDREAIVAFELLFIS